MKLLFVDCCISQRGEGSRTKRLAKAYLDAFLKSHPGTEVEMVTPEMLLALRPFDAAMLDERDALAAENAGTRRYSPWPASCVGRTRWWWRRPTGT